MLTQEQAVGVALQLLIIVRHGPLLSIEAAILLGMHGIGAFFGICALEIPPKLHSTFDSSQCTSVALAHQHLVSRLPVQVTRSKK
jgi:hypothetical protein